MHVLGRALTPVVLVATLALGANAGTYVVRPGDTLSAIASRLGVSVRDLAGANGIDDPNLVFAGQRLSVPGGSGGSSSGAVAAQGAGRTHVVAPGETLTAIAARYGTSIRAIVVRNELRDPNHLRIGVTLQVPSTPPSSSLPSRLLASPNRMALIPHFKRWSQANGIDPALVMAIAWQESGWQNDVVSSAGAIGIGQLLPSTAEFVEHDLIGAELDPRIPEDNIRMTARYVGYLLKRTGGDVDLMLAGYYQGLASVASIGFLPSTKDYIAIVRSLRPRFANA